MKNTFRNTTQNSSGVNTIIVAISIVTITTAFGFAFYNQKRDETPAEISGQDPQEHEQAPQEHEEDPQEQEFEEQEPEEQPQVPYQYPNLTVENKEPLNTNPPRVLTKKGLLISLGLAGAKIFHDHGNKFFYPSNASTAVQKTTSPPYNYKTEFEAARMSKSPNSEFSVKTPVEKFLQDTDTLRGNAQTVSKSRKNTGKNQVGHKTRKAYTGNIVDSPGLAKGFNPYDDFSPMKNPTHPVTPIDQPYRDQVDKLMKNPSFVHHLMHKKLPPKLTTSQAVSPKVTHGLSPSTLTTNATTTETVGAQFAHPRYQSTSPVIRPVMLNATNTDAVGMSLAATTSPGLKPNKAYTGNIVDIPGPAKGFNPYDDFSSMKNPTHPVTPIDQQYRKQVDKLMKDPSFVQDLMYKKLPPELTMSQSVPPLLPYGLGPSTLTTNATNTDAVGTTITQQPVPRVVGADAKPQTLYTTEMHNNMAGHPTAFSKFLKDYYHRKPLAEHPGARIDISQVKTQQQQPPPPVTDNTVKPTAVIPYEDKNQAILDLTYGSVYLTLSTVFMLPLLAPAAVVSTAVVAPMLAPALVASSLMFGGLGVMKFYNVIENSESKDIPVASLPPPVEDFMDEEIYDASIKESKDIPVASLPPPVEEVEEFEDVISDPNVYFALMDELGFDHRKGLNAKQYLALKKRFKENIENGLYVQIS